jgi:hypothetical protein
MGIQSGGGEHNRRRRNWGTSLDPWAAAAEGCPILITEDDGGGAPISRISEDEISSRGGSNGLFAYFDAKGHSHRHSDMSREALRAAVGI